MLLTISPAGSSCCLFTPGKKQCIDMVSMCHTGGLPHKLQSLGDEDEGVAFIRMAMFNIACRTLGRLKSSHELFDKLWLIAVILMGRLAT
jgi:hypothetical protein